MFSLQTSPAKQSVSDTINVLSGRLGSATLLEDRRAAILGLRSFAKEFPASVASGALRSLIGSLSKDGEDVDTVKVVLETLLMLFSPNEDSPEASDEIALWLADEFTQRQENITLLLDFLDSPEFYSRLYSLQLLAAILSARTQRTEECILTAPLGISRLTAILEDQREVVRNEAITFLTYLTASSMDIQKLVAFENAFDRIFTIVDADGSLLEGGRTVEDCLILLANLLRRNSSNQSLFRESGCINRLSDLLNGFLKVQSSENDTAEWAQTQRNRNLYAFLAVIRLLLMNGSVGTPQNQNSLWRHGLANSVLQLAFSAETQSQIQAEALSASGDMMRDNAPLQESFARLMVPSPLRDAQMQKQETNGQAKVYVIDGLLELMLNRRDLTIFDVRYAACECLKAYFSKHEEVRLHFLGRAIDGHCAVGDESANVLSVLLSFPDKTSSSDPYRSWFAAVIMFHLLFDNPSAKAKLQSLTDGDSSNGEEVVTSIQTICANIIAGIRQKDDMRILVGYLMVLIGWLFEDIEAVNDFLSEGSNIQSLVQVVTQPTAHHEDEIVPGLCAMLLGVAYEFSTKDSPISRASLHSILTSRLDRDRYIDRLSKLRSHSIIRDFEVIPQKTSAVFPSTLPEVIFDADFLSFFKDNYGRILRAIDREPELEISIITNGVQRGISRELVDSLRSQIEERDRSLKDKQAAVDSLQSRLGQEMADHRRSKEQAAAETSKAQSASEGRQKSYDAELRKLQSQLDSRQAGHKSELERLQSRLVAKEAENEKKMLQVRKSAESEAERIQRRTEAEVADLRATISRLEVDLLKMKKGKTQELHALEETHSQSLKDLISKLEQAEKRVHDLEGQLDKSHAENDELRQRVVDAESALKAASQDKENSQTELDDLLIVFGDIEDKVAKYKVRLRALGEAVSEAEDGEEESSSDEVENDDVD